MACRQNIFQNIPPLLIVLIFHGFSITPIHAQMFDIQDSLILHLPMEGNASDQSGNNIPTEVNGPTLTEDRFGNSNSAYKFDGNGEHISLNNDLPVITARSFTILLWVKINGPSNTVNKDQTFFQQRDDDASAATAKSTIHFCISREYKVRASLRTYPTPNGLSDNFEGNANDYNDWHHYVLRLDEERNVDLFLDAVKISSGTLSEPGDFITSIDHVDLGLHYYSGVIKAALNGAIDDVYIYNRALTECEILFLFTGSLPEER